MAYGDVASAISAVQNSGANRTECLAFEFMVLTAARTRDVLLAKWDEIDLEEETWVIPARRMKNGRNTASPCRTGQSK